MFEEQIRFMFDVEKRNDRHFIVRVKDGNASFSLDLNRNEIRAVEYALTAALDLTEDEVSVDIGTFKNITVEVTGKYYYTVKINDWDKEENSVVMVFHKEHLPTIAKMIKDQL